MAVAMEEVRAEEMAAGREWVAAARVVVVRAPGREEERVAVERVVAEA